MKPEDVNLIMAIASPLIGVAGVFLGARITSSKDERKRKLEWKEKQLREFYAPLWSLRAEIETLSIIRTEIGRKAFAECQKLILQSEGMDSVARGKYVEQINEQYTVDVTYHNDQLKTVLLPKYREMQRIFAERLHLADPETTDFYPILIAYNEMWKRGDECNLPFEIATFAAVKEKKLHPFYKHLEFKTTELREAISSGRSERLSRHQAKHLLKNLDAPEMIDRQQLISRNLVNHESNDEEQQA